MRVLVIGSGGREHSLVWKIAQSSRVEKIFCAPGNPGIGEIAECVNISPEQIPLLMKFAVQEKIDLTVVGPEAPLVDGIVDEFRKNKLDVFGPDKNAAILESSKVFTKRFLKKYGIPSAEFANFNDYDDARRHILSRSKPMVIKADGLSKGKGVFVCKSENEALDAISAIMKDKVFGDAGDRVVIEDFLSGEEVSVLLFTDGKTLLSLETSQDHKTIYDGDKGPNTGGMGAYSPVPFMTAELSSRVEKQILIPTINAMNSEGRPYKGILYVGLMMTEQGPKVLEFNVRFGDPEAQVILTRMKSDIVPIMQATISGNLQDVDIEWHPQSSLCVVMTSGGYPGHYVNGKEISGLDQLKDRPDTQVFHAGTKYLNGKVVTSGGRVLNIVACGNDIREAQKRAYDAAGNITFEGVYFRKDIGFKAIVER
ncbi:MAG: phosphoribosylamine--glycine ligase [Candidatus Scalindua sp. AMX11]|nr:MAG: phosphoribosylamine--glycine ligase [Candidatus Scalindua sp.]NOG82672.1 phosphoribosylamine--glycine ligase [Planctomycetota bacterium]RZV95246.1 MAG: phosphoribosylamine--glycine ligase [Candidatus Scalindua sp. SCAELEC01]TDE66274.1 MAG: phosphoribosylamine--glycine ligase [Candidatus Scalindua sp. AMX11]GJQ57897.1 MAG: phosphoribosylamine--glycine ligase [Candidatus Scalindua sp.]